MRIKYLLSHCPLAFGAFLLPFTSALLLLLLTPAHTLHAAPRSVPLFDCETPIRIMPVGDSITKGSGTPFFTGYRQLLYTNLRGLGYDVDFVGSETNGGGTPLAFDLDHEGHSGQTADWVADNITDFLDANPADLLLLHIGTNDLLDGESPQSTVDDVEAILKAINAWERANDTEVTVLLARIINHPTLDPDVSIYNSLLTDMAQSRIRDGDQIVLVDMESAAGLAYGPNSPDWSDAIHPSYTGYQKMAKLWRQAIQANLSWPVCLPLQVTLTPASTTVTRGAALDFTVMLTNTTSVTLTNVTALDSPLSDCNRSLSNLAAGQRIHYACTATDLTDDLLNYVTIEAERPTAGAIHNTAATYTTVVAIRNLYLPFAARSETVQ